MTETAVHAAPGPEGKPPAAAAIDAAVFDAYGTIFDVMSVLGPARAKLGAKAEQLGETWRRKQLEYTWLRSQMGLYADFWHVTGESLDFAMAAQGIEDGLMRASLMQAYLSIGAYKDSGDVLARLKKAGKKTAILSNGNMSMLVAAANHAQISQHLDAVLSIDEVRVYKPHPSVYKLVTDKLGVPAARVLFVSGNGWDAAGAAAQGFQSLWINRASAPYERLPGQVRAQIKGIGDVPAAIGL